MSNIEKIKAEIERRRDFFYERYMQKGIGCIEETRYDECVEILSFIDSLPDCTVKTNGQGRVKDDVYDSLQEEKPSEDLEEEIEMEWDSFNKHLAEYGEESEDVVWLNLFSFRDVACYFYKLGKQSKETVSHDLKEAAEECIGTLIPEEVHTTTPFAAEYVIKLLDKAFIAGAEWGKKAMRDQMIEDAVDGEIVKDINNMLAVTSKGINLNGFQFGDKVKIIIVKK